MNLVHPSSMRPEQKFEEYTTFSSSPTSELTGGWDLSSRRQLLDLDIGVEVSNGVVKIKH